MLHMVTADLLELSRWGAMWNAEVEQLNQASAIACISCVHFRLLTGGKHGTTLTLLRDNVTYTSIEAAQGRGAPRPRRRRSGRASH